MTPAASTSSLARRWPLGERSIAALKALQPLAPLVARLGVASEFFFAQA